MKGSVRERSGHSVSLDSMLTGGAFPGAGSAGSCQGQGLGPLRCQASDPALGSGIGVREKGKHTDLLLMAKQLGDQGGLSKNLQEREGEGYGETKAGGWGRVFRLGYKRLAGWPNVLPRLAEA